jgi:ParB family chromosome partitioning protein
MIAEQVGLSRPVVANTLRLLNLPLEIKDSLRKDEITMGHARALLGLPQPALMQRLWKKIVSQGLSVRQTEAAVKDLTAPAEKKPEKPAKIPEKPQPTKPAFLNQVEVELLSRLNTKVRVKPKDNDTGSIEISYYSHDDLERLLNIILGRPEQAQE